MEIEGLKELQEILENVEKKADDVDGNLSIDVELILKNLDQFNEKFSSDFSEHSSEGDFANFFSDAYIEIIKDNLFEKKSPKDIFNKKFNPYAKI